MNYQEYVSLKRSCTLKIKIFSVALYAIAVFSVIQAGLLLFNVDKSIGAFNMHILDLFYSYGYEKSAQGNMVLGFVFYASFGLCIFSFVASSILSILGSSKFQYTLCFAIYSVDALLCLITGQYSAVLLHIAFLLMIAIALKNRRYLGMLKNNVWGYE
ncbi:MAG: hypothetical protein FWG10_12395 [Eubacteriaceae bacterium]|nr:hypothetical protein [Eubacteriaceae bacterium]